MRRGYLVFPVEERLHGRDIAAAHHGIDCGKPAPLK
jgi:hypothetical protein